MVTEVFENAKIVKINKSKVEKSIKICTFSHNSRVLQSEPKMAYFVDNILILFHDLTCLAM